MSLMAWIKMFCLRNKRKHKGSCWALKASCQLGTWERARDSVGLLSGFRPQGGAVESVLPSGPKVPGVSWS